MRLTSRAHHSRFSKQFPSSDLQTPSYLYQTPRKETPEQTASRYHHAKRETCPGVIQGKQNSPYPTEDYCSTFKASTHAVFDSRKADQVKNYREEWKILTL